MDSKRNVWANVQVIRVPANASVTDFLNKLTTIYTPSDIRAALDSLKASFEIVNEKAKNYSDWTIFYNSFMEYYKNTRDQVGWLSSGQGTIDRIKQYERELIEWQKTLEKRGLDTGPKRQPDPPKSGSGSLDDLIKLVPYAIGAYALYKVLK
jgi:hypothetical protein